jgi:hypothetical protein
MIGVLPGVTKTRQAEEVAEKLKLFVILSEAKNPSSI